MATKFGLDQKEEGKSYSALFVLMIALLLVGAVWSIWDDNISRRPWKQYQVRFDKLAYEHYVQQAATVDKQLAQDPNYVHLTQQLAAAQKELASGATEAKLADLKTQLVGAKTIADEKDQAVRFTKSELTEYWYDYNHAIQVGQNPAPIKAEIDKLNARLAAEQAVSDQALAVQTAIQSQIDAINSKVEDLTEQLTKITKDRDDLLDKADSWMIPVKFGKHVLFRYPKIPKIDQDSIDDFDRNAFDQAIARVDRCQSCHVGEDKRGF